MKGGNWLTNAYTFPEHRITTDHDLENARNHFVSNLVLAALWFHLLFFSIFVNSKKDTSAAFHYYTNQSHCIARHVFWFRVTIIVLGYLWGVVDFDIACTACRCFMGKVGSGNRDYLA